VNSRGNRLFTCRWTPKALEPRALIFICHGYGAECSISMGDTAARLVHSGFAVYGIDHEGHGKSSGSKGYISNFSAVVKDCSDHFKSVCGEDEAVNPSCYVSSIVPHCLLTCIAILHFQRSGRTSQRRGSSTASPWEEPWCFSSIGRILSTGTVPCCLPLCARSLTACVPTRSSSAH